MYNVEYKGGQSRYGTDTVDYMLVNVNGVELYAEAAASDGESYDELKDAITTQAKENGIDPAALRFLYDNGK